MGQLAPASYEQVYFESDMCFGYLRLELMIALLYWRLEKATQRGQAWMINGVLLLAFPCPNAQTLGMWLIACFHLESGNGGEFAWTVQVYDFGWPFFNAQSFATGKRRFGPKVPRFHLLDVASKNRDIQRRRDETGLTLMWLMVLHLKLTTEYLFGTGTMLCLL